MIPEHPFALIGNLRKSRSGAIAIKPSGSLPTTRCLSNYLQINRPGQATGFSQTKFTATIGTTGDSDGNSASLTYSDGRVLYCTCSARSQLLKSREMRS